MKELIYELKSKNIRLSVDRDELVVDFEGDTLPSELISKIRENKSSLINYLSKYKTEVGYTEIPAISGGKEYPISFAQHRMWVLSQFEEASVAYNIPGSINLDTEVDVELFKDAVYKVVKRHEILRTVFVEDGENGQVSQVILPFEELGFQINQVDLRKDADPEESAREFIAKDSFTPFDLAKGPLLRTALLQTSDNTFVFYYNMHHIISDDWSMKVLSNDVFAFYKAAKSGANAGIKDLRIQYKDYATWQRAQLEEDAFSIHRSYWLERLSGELSLIDLPASRQRPVVKTHNGRNLVAHFDETTTRHIKKFSERNGGTQFITVLALWNTLVHKYTGLTDITIGTPVAGREHTELENQIGFYVNTMALRNEIKPTESFIAFYRRIKEATLSAYSHQAYPFDKLVEELKIKRDTSRNPVFDISMTYHNTATATAVGTLDKNYLEEIHDFGALKIKNDIEVHFEEVGDYLSFRLIYNEDVYEKEMIEQLMRHYKSLVNETLLSPDKKIRDISYLTEEEREQLLVEFGRGAQSVWENENVPKTLIDCFEAQVALTPENKALVIDGKAFSYSELNELSNRFANCLKTTYNIAPEDLVGIQLERNEWMIIAILGVLKAGGAYVPIDPEYPSKRKEFIMRDSDVRVLITASSFIYDIDYYDGDVFAVDVEFEADDFSPGQPNREITADNLAYVIYTSGSTGQPKGVMINHGAVLNTIMGQIKVFGLNGDSKGLQFASFSFDASVSEMFIILLSGGSLILTTEKDRKDPELLTNLMQEQEVNVATLPPSYLEKIDFEKLAHFTTLITAGEPANAANVSAFLKEGKRYYNAYGPTEASICGTVFRLENSLDNVDGYLPIGEPIDNVSILVLGANNELQPVGVAGEICIAGAGLARGYLNQPELTKEKFVENPFVSDQLMYRTGDMGKWLQNGKLTFIGRKDDQLKIRGYRVEPGEIEQVLLQHSDIKEAVVVARISATDDENREEKELVAYFTAETELSIADIQTQLKKALPAYMQPSYYMQLDALPLTGNGKIDKKSLPNPEGMTAQGSVAYVAPETEMEKKLVAIWENVLQLEKVGLKDDFFALGGHSLKALRLVNEFQKQFEIKLSVNELFVHTTPEAQCQLVAGSKKETFTAIPKLQEAEHYAISDAQRRLWVLSQFKEGSVAYNIPGSITLDRALNIENFRKAINQILARHEILRTVFKEDETGEIRQWVLQTETIGFVVDYQDYRGQAKPDDEVNEYIQQDAYLSFDLENGPLLRTALLQTDDERFIFYFNMHHIISDGWSMEVLSSEVMTCYEAINNDEDTGIEPLRIQYKDYAAWQLDQLETDRFDKHKAYWVNKLSGDLPVLDLPGTLQRPTLKTYNGRTLGMFFDKEIGDLLKAHINQNGGSLFIELMATLNVLFYRYTGQTDLIIGSPVAGREHADLQEQIGFYVNTLAFRNSVHPQLSFNDFYKDVKEQTLEGYAHQMYPFDRLVEELDLPLDTSRSAVFDVMLVLQNNGENNAVDIEESRLNEITDYGSKTSKFDLLVSVEEQGDLMSCTFEYNTDVYQYEMVKGLMLHYKTLLTELLKTPDQSLGEISYLSDKEQGELRTDLNATTVSYAPKTVMELFEEQVKRTPESVAVEFRGIELTYAELNNRSNLLANRLIENHGVESSTKVGVMLERSVESIVAMIGVMKTGACYIPIDHNYPTERVRYIMNDSELKFVLGDQDLCNKHGIEVERFVDLYKADAETENINNPEINVSLDNGAFVIYTSGSTGNPKGVVQTHRMMSNLIQWDIRDSGVESGLKHLQYASFSFDASLHDIYFVIGSSGIVYLVDEDTRLDYQKLKDEIVENKVEVLSMPFSALSAFCSEVAIHELENHTIKYIISTAEQLYVNASLEEFLEANPSVELHNHYGPSETHVVTAHIMSVARKNVESRSPIGVPISNTTAYVLDEQLNLVPKGVMGELYFGGANLAIGYLNLEKATAERFIESPFIPGEKLYKTGDLGRWLPDNTLEFLGRKDDQVKVRGYRIELGEIQQALLKNNAIEEAVVLVKEQKEEDSLIGEKQLVAYITASEEQNVTGLRETLKAQLPDYMIPAFFVQLEKMPLTPNGKVDKKALPNPTESGMKSGVEYVPAENEIQEKMVKIWEEVLQKEKIGIKDDFFEAGGHSLKAVQLTGEIQKEFGVKVELSKIFQLTTIEKLAEFISLISWDESDNDNEIEEFKI